jgi:hypothetical protein
MEQDELIAIEVLQTINTGNPNPKNFVSTTCGLLPFTYEDLMSERKDASMMKRLLNHEERLVFNKLRRRVLSRKYSCKSRILKKNMHEILKTDKERIIDKARELFADHPNMSQFDEFIQAISVSLKPANF